MKRFMMTGMMIIVLCTALATTIAPATALNARFHDAYMNTLDRH
jgi:hypothetical protein